MTGLLYIFTFITAVLIVVTLHDLCFGGKKRVKARLENVNNMTPLSEEEEVMRRPIIERLIIPSYQRLLKFIGNIAPKQIKQKYENIINNAGSYKNVTFTGVVAVQIMTSLIFGGALFLILFQNNKLNIILILIALVIGFMIHLSFIRIKADIRKKKITRALPNLLDLLYVSVEAGLGFDMALKKTVTKMNGPLSDEINRSLDEISRGKNRQDALRGMVKRTGVDDLAYFVTSIIQTEQLGSSITNMLKIQANTMRQKRKQRAEEAAMKVPVKMLFPLIFFIFPSLLIIILGPAIIRISETLNKIL